MVLLDNTFNCQDYIVLTELKYEYGALLEWQ